MRYWCLNFDPTVMDRAEKELPLTHGLKEDLWLMQYQYSHEGQICQGGTNQISITTRNWRAMSDISPGDQCVAYVPGPRFYAVATIVEPKRRMRHNGKPGYHDTIKRTTSDGRHLHFDGIVFYDDASVFYEDFTDDWELKSFEKDRKREDYKYAQRIDVQEWLHVVQNGIRLTGLKDAAKSKQLIGSAIIEIDKTFFDRVTTALLRPS